MHDKPAVALSVVVPVYNEGGNLLPMSEAFAPWLDRIAGENCWQFVFVDNGSTDGSADEIAAICQRWPTCKLIVVDRPDFGYALRRGLAAVDGEWAHIINVDLWDPVFLAWSWLSRDRYELVIGSKRADPTLNHQFPYRRILSWGLNTILQTVFGSVCTDTHGLKLLHMPVMRPILEKTLLNRGQFDTEFVLRAFRAGLWIAEVPIPIVELRPPRNLMVQKVLRNLRDIVRLGRLMRDVPISGPIRYHRWARIDLVQAVVDRFGSEGLEGELVEVSESMQLAEV